MKSNSSSHTSWDCTAVLFAPKHTFQDGNQCTYQTWLVQLLYGRTGDFEEFSIANIGPPLKKLKFQFTYFPGLYSSATWEEHTFQDGKQCTYQTWPVQFLYGRTGAFEEFSIANTGFPFKKLKFQFTFIPGLYSSAVWTKTHLSRLEPMYIPDLTCTVPVRPHRGLWRILHS